MSTTIWSSYWLSSSTDPSSRYPQRQKIVPPLVHVGWLISPGEQRGIVGLISMLHAYSCLCLPSLIAISFPRLQCHGLWDEDDPKRKKEPSAQSESEDESKGREQQSDGESEPASSVISESRSSSHTSISGNFGTAIDPEHIQVHVPQQQTYQRRWSSSGGSHISHRSLHSSARSKRGEDFSAWHLFVSKARSLIFLATCPFKPHTNPWHSSSRIYWFKFRCFWSCLSISLRLFTPHPLVEQIEQISLLERVPFVN